jgi:hypothetical protein
MKVKKMRKKIRKKKLCLAKQEEISKINCQKFNQTNEKEEKNKKQKQ